MDMRPTRVLVKKIIAALVVVTKEHSRPDAEQRKIIITRPACFHKISIPGTAVVEGKHHVLCSNGDVSKQLVGIIEYE